jgi:hypothetical protein
MPFDHCGHTAINFVFLCTCVDIDFTDSPLCHQYSNSDRHHTVALLAVDAAALERLFLK